MANTSATGGIIAPSTPSPVFDQNQDVFLQGIIASLSGISGDLVRPRWQPTVPQQPAADANWVALGIDVDTPEGMPFVRHDGYAAGSDQMTRWRRVEAMASFYGPNGEQIAAQVSDGFWIAQNRDALNAAGYAFVEADDIRIVPELVNQQWIRRADLRLVFRRAVSRTYPVLNLLSATGTIKGDGFEQAWSAP